MVELFKSIPSNCKFNKEQKIKYNALLLEFKKVTGGKLDTCNCACRKNMRMLTNYLKKSKQI